jgi:hypothetical protein
MRANRADTLMTDPAIAPAESPPPPPPPSSPPPPPPPLGGAPTVTVGMLVTVTPSALVAAEVEVSALVSVVEIEVAAAAEAVAMLTVTWTEAGTTVTVIADSGTPARLARFCLKVAVSKLATSPGAVNPTTTGTGHTAPTGESNVWS